LCEEVSGADGAEWADARATRATARQVDRLRALVARRRAGEPLQYVIGAWPFRGLTLMVDRRVLIPRPETEEVVGVALELAAIALRPGPHTIVDLGTGSGAIALSLVAELPLGSAAVWATDMSKDALDVARANLAGIGRAAAHVRLAQGHWYEALDDRLRASIDLVVSNPPYVAAGEPLPEVVRAWEPPLALEGGAHGLDALRIVIGEAGRWLRPDGVLVVEIGATQGPAAAALARAAGLRDVAVRRDMAGHDRVLTARSVFRPG
jgi:release factor glutamine methyltransferase